MLTREYKLFFLQFILIFFYFLFYFVIIFRNINYFFKTKNYYYANDNDNYDLIYDIHPPQNNLHEYYNNNENKIKFRKHLKSTKSST